MKGLLMVLPIAIGTAAAHAADVIRATPPRGYDTRLARFAARDSDDSLRLLADELAEAIDLETPGVAEGFAKLYAEGRHREAIAAYAGYVLGKLKDPERYGVPAMCVSPEDPNPSKARMDASLGLLASGSPGSVRLPNGSTLASEDHGRQWLESNPRTGRSRSQWRGPRRTLTGFPLCPGRVLPGPRLTATVPLEPDCTPTVSCGQAFNAVSGLRSRRRRRPG